MSYQKFYTNPIQSSSLLCQLASMWKNDIMCDAIIKAGSICTKAHRVVMMAACPMLQSMDHATSGSRLEIRLSSDIQQQSIQAFLQYLYEGFMMVTEENYKDIEKIGRLLQVDSVIKCCADFCKSLTSRKGSLSNQERYRYTFCDMIEFRHVRSSDLQRTVSDMQMKRSHDMPGHEQGSGVKRLRKRHSSDHLVSSNRGVTTQPNGSVEGRVLLDSLELVQVDAEDPGGSCQSVGVGVVSHSENDNETSVVVPSGDCCDTVPACTSPSLSVPGSSPSAVTRNLTPSETAGHLTPSETAGRGQSPNQSSDGMTEMSRDSVDRATESTRNQTISDEHIRSEVSQAESTNSEQHLVPDLSIVKVEAGSIDHEKHRLLEQEQIAADYKHSNSSPQHGSRSSESMDTGQQGTRSYERSPPKSVESVAALNEQLRFPSGIFMRKLSDHQLTHSGDLRSSSAHRNFLLRQNHQGKQARSPAIASPPYSPLPVTSGMLTLPPVSALSQFMLPPPTHHPVTTKQPPPTGLIDLSDDSVGEICRSGDSQPPAVHKLMYIPNRKPCTWCQIKGVKTKSGWYCYASYKCDVCDVPLCKQGRVCFQEYHRHIGIPDSEIYNPNSETGAFMFDFNPNK